MDTIGKKAAAAVARPAPGQQPASDTESRQPETWPGLNLGWVATFINKIISKTCYFDCRYLQSSVRCLLKSLTQDENWMVTQAKRKREKEDVYKKYPQLDPVFMKI